MKEATKKITITSFVKEGQTDLCNQYQARIRIGNWKHLNEDIKSLFYNLINKKGYTLSIEEKRKIKRNKRTLETFEMAKKILISSEKERARRQIVFIQIPSKKLTQVELIFNLSSKKSLNEFIEKVKKFNE